MAIAMLTFHQLLTPLQGLAHWFFPKPRAQFRRPVPQQRAAASRPGGARGRPMPLRVVRVLEGTANPAGAGRMVISGRMADVCAELDRLAALEAKGR